jgi:SpoIIAA-like
MLSCPRAGCGDATWQGCVIEWVRTPLSALGDHLSLVREHYRVPERIAIVGNNTWQKMAGKIMAKFVNAQTKFFDSGDYDGAIAWVAE